MTNNVNEWFTDNGYVDHAEKVISKGKIARGQRGDRNRNITEITALTTTQIRNLLSLSAAIYDKAVALESNELDDDIKSDLAYLRIQFVYQSGRDGSPNKTGVKNFVEKAEILNVLKNIKDKQTLVRFCRYMEALVAYFKYAGGREK